MNLADRADSTIRSLSHGMRKRVMLAQCFIGSPEVVLLDEPLNGLDPAEQSRMRNFILARRGRQTIVVSSHNLNDVEILCIVPWVDSIYDARQENCLNDLGADSKTMHVYEGDLFVLLNKGTDNYWNRPEQNGVYVCRWGAYRRLLYTVGRGYLDIDKKPNVASTDDEDDELGDVFCYDEHRWNHHLLTMDHKWKRIGNIHADVTLLMEKKPKEE